MNIKDLKKYLENFDLKEEVINEFLEEKNLIEVNSNFFLVRNDFEKNQVFSENLVFIGLKKLLPSKYLLEFIRKNSKDLNVKNQKRASDFTYGESIKQESFSNANNLKQNKYYIICFDDKIIGVGNFFNKQLHNIFNIGEYLEEKKE